MTEKNKENDEQKHALMFAHDHAEAIWGIVLFILMAVGMWAFSLTM